MPAYTARGPINKPPDTPPAVLAYPTDPGQVPAEFAPLPNFVGWRWERRGGKWTKPPVSPTTGARGDCSDPSTWGTFAQAVDTARRGRLPGVGIQLTEEMRVVGGDLDKCRHPETGEIAPWALAIVRRLNTLTYVSPTGTGLRFFLKGRLPGRRRRIGNIEVYTSGRYLTLTTELVPGTPPSIEERQAELEAWYAEVFPPESPRPAAPQTVTSGTGRTLTDAEVVRRASAATNGETFRRLWAGDASGHGGDDSGADLALCNLLRFWTGGDGAQVDRLFRRSGLYRAKWDDRRGAGTYGSRTVARAIRGEVYTPAPPKETNGHHAGAGGSSGPPPSAPAPAPTLTRPQPDGHALTDVGNAERLLARCGELLRYTPLWHRWLVYDAGRWVPDTDECRVRGHAKETVRQMARDALALFDHDPAGAKALFDHAARCEAAGRLAAMVLVAQSFAQVWVTPDDLDADPWLLNCRNGTVDLTTGGLRPHRPADLLTKMAPVDYDPTAGCPRWERFIAEVTCDDPELAEYLQRAIGHSLTGDVSEQAVYFPYGQGSNGKSTLLNTVKAAAGEYAMQAKDDLLLVKRGESHPTELADLYRRRLVVSTEVEDGRRLAEALVKQLTGGERVRARRMREDFWEFDPTHKVWVAANHKPEIRGTDFAIWRRIRLIPFDATFYDRPEDVPAGQPPRLKDPALADTLRAELPGVLAWAVTGSVAWREDGIAVPGRVQVATAQYREEMDVLAAFLEDRCELLPQASAPATLLYQAYDAWCTTNGEKAESQRKFGDRLSERGYAKSRDMSNGRIVRIGLRLRVDDTPAGGAE